MPKYNELALQVFHREQNLYTITATANVAPFVATSPTEIDPRAPEIAELLEQIEAEQTDDFRLKEVGAWLFERLFVRGTANGAVHSVRDIYTACLLDALTTRKRGVRIVLQFTANTTPLYELPWMLLHDQARARWLSGTNTPHQWTPLSYDVHMMASAMQQLPLPLKILVVAASPHAPGLAPIDAHLELEHIQRAFQGLAERRLVHIETLTPSAHDPVTQDALRGRLRVLQPHVLHFIGHGPQSRNTALATPLLFLERDARDHPGKFPVDLCSADALLMLLQDAGASVQLAVLNACNSDGVAWQLAQQGIVAIGMRYKVYEDAAPPFSQGLYEALVAGCPVDEAVNRARARLVQHVTVKVRDWAAPVLFLPLGQSLRGPQFQGLIEVSSTPPGAQIRWKTGGGPWQDSGEQTPATLYVDVGPSYTIQAQKDGYTPQEDTMLVPSAGLYPVTFSLEREQARLQVVTTARGTPLPSVKVVWYAATDVTQSYDLGMTDARGVLEADVPVGACRLQAQHVPTAPGPYYGAQECGPVALCAGSNQIPIEFVGTDEPLATLRIASFLGKAEVWVNDVLHPDGQTPVTLTVSPGVYRVQVKRAGCFPLPKERRIHLQALSSAALHFLLLPLRGWQPLCVLLVAFGVGIGMQDWWMRAHRFPADMVVFPAGEFRKGGESTPLIELMRKYADHIANLATLMEAKPETGRIAQGFFLDQYEVTNQDYRQFLSTIQNLSPAEHRRLHPDDPQGKDHTPALWQDATYNQPDQPVVGVDWYDAVAYCRSARKRLPTGDEWERAARGTDGRLYPWGDQFDKKKASTGEGPYTKPLKGGQYTGGRSPEGVEDLVGNVSEWTAEAIEVDTQQGKVIRGGSWNEPGEIYGLGFLQRGATPTYRERDLGFRCAQERTGAATPPPRMLLIPAGDFLKGARERQPSFLLTLARERNLSGTALRRLILAKPEQVSLNTFALDSHEVTNQAYRQFLGKGAHQATEALPEQQARSSEDKEHAPAPETWNDTKFNQPRHPVVGVNWYDAVAYCRWMGKRLPTEDEWERAARGTEGRRYPWGDSFDDDRCNSSDGRQPAGKTAPLGAYARCKSPEGVYDLVGNADEWTSTKTTRENGKEGRVLRGGSWEESGELRGLAYVQTVAGPDYRGKDVGIRCAADPRRSWWEKLQAWLGLGH